jgi:molybdopterin synthase catalytic subunit
MESVPTSNDWIVLSSDTLAPDVASSWAITPSCGAVVTFAGMVRDHSEGRDGVSGLEYEAYIEQVEPRLQVIADLARERWPMIGRLVLWHRIGTLYVGEVSVVCVASTPHRPECFASARFLIDTIKASVPIWKKETWQGGSDWSLCDHEIEDLSFAEEEREILLAEIDHRSGSRAITHPLESGLTP